MKTPVARKLAAADARRVAAVRAARAAAASRRAAAAKRRMLLLSVLGALTISGWILTAMVSLPWIVPAVLTAASVGAVELGRRAAVAGAKADAEFAEKVKAAEARAGVNSRNSSVAAKLDRAVVEPAAEPSGESTSAVEEEAPASSLRVAVDPTAGGSWTPVPVPPPAYTLKAEVRRKIAEPYQAPSAEEAAEAPAIPAEATKVPGTAPSLPEAEPEAAPASAAPASAASAPSAPASSVDTGSLNVQEILARRRAVG